MLVLSFSRILSTNQVGWKLLISLLPLSPSWKHKKVLIFPSLRTIVIESLRRVQSQFDVLEEKVPKAGNKISVWDWLLNLGCEEKGLWGGRWGWWGWEHKPTKTLSLIRIRTKLLYEMTECVGIVLTTPIWDVLVVEKDKVLLCRRNCEEGLGAINI